MNEQRTACLMAAVLLAMAVLAGGCANTGGWTRRVFNDDAPAAPPPAPAGAADTDIVAALNTGPGEEEPELVLAHAGADSEPYDKPPQILDVTPTDMTGDALEVQRLRDEMEFVKDSLLTLNQKVAELEIQAHFFTGIAYEALGEYSAALDIFKTILDQNATTAFAADSCFKIGVIYKNRYNDYDAAIRYFRRLINNYPSSSRNRLAYYELGTAYAAKGEYGESNNYYRRMVRNYPDFDKAPEAVLAVAQNLVKMDQTADAIGECRNLLQRYPSARVADQAQYRIGEYLRNLGRTDEAIEAFQKVIANYSRSGLAGFAQFEIAETYVAAGNNDAARNAYETYLRQYPDGVYVDRARTQLDRLP